MNEPVRLCDGDDDAAKRMMLAMREERSPPGAAQRALVALGAAGATLTAGGAAAGAGVGAGKSAWLVLIKWLGGGAALGLAVGGGASLISPPEVRSKPSPAALATTEPAHELPATLEAPAPAEPEQPETETPAAPTARTTPVGPVEPAPAPDPGAAPAASFEAPQPDMLAREVELLDQARHAVGRGDATQALATLDRFSRDFPRARLSAEAFVVRLQALMRAGRAAEARTLAEQHLRARPSSPHAQRIRAITGLGAAP